jgi:chromosome segregation ATPase
MSETIDPARLQQIREQLYRLVGNFSKIPMTRRDIEVAGLLRDAAEFIATQDEALRRLQQERDAAHAHACEASLEERDLRKQLKQAEQERDALRQEKESLEADILKWTAEAATLWKERDAMREALKQIAEMRPFINHPRWDEKLAREIQDIAKAALTRPTDSTEAP